MIVYTPFWEMLKDKNITQYALINHYKISAETVNRLRHNKPVSLNRIDDLCKMFDCNVENIIKFENYDIKK